MQNLNYNYPKVPIVTIRCKNCGATREHIAIHTGAFVNTCHFCSGMDWEVVKDNDGNPI